VFAQRDDAREREREDAHIGRERKRIAAAAVVIVCALVYIESLFNVIVWSAHLGSKAESSITTTKSISTH
jgi:hypothetical protein